MILQIRLPGVGDALQQGASNFIQTLVQKERLEQQERAMELRERDQDLREQRFEMEQAAAQAQQQNALQSLLAQTGGQPGASFPIQAGAPAPQAQQPQGLPAGPAQAGQPPTAQVQQPQQTAGFQSPVAQQATQQIAQTAGDARTSERAFETQLARAPGAAEAEVGAEQQQAQRQARQTFRTAAQAAQGADVEDVPSADEFMQSAEMLGVPSETVNTIRETVYGTEAEDTQRQLEQGQRRTQIQGLVAVQQRMSEGQSLTQLARSNDPLVSVGAGVLENLGPDIRDVRGMLQSRDQDISDFYRSQAEQFAENNPDLMQNIPVSRLSAFINPSQDAELPDQIEDTVRERFDQFSRRTRLAAQAGAAGNVAELPSVQALDQEISVILQSLDEGDTVEDLDDEQQRRLNELFDRKATLAEERLGISRSDPNFPFPTRVEEVEEGGFLGIGGSNSFDLSVTSEGRALHGFILNQGGGSVDQALQRATELRAQASEEQRADFQALIDQLRRLSEAGVDEIRSGERQQ